MLMFTVHTFAPPAGGMGPLTAAGGSLFATFKLRFILIKIGPNPAGVYTGGVRSAELSKVHKSLPRQFSLSMPG